MSHVGVAAALLRQVMSLTPQQIELLPEAQKQQVVELQRQLVSPLIDIWCHFDGCRVFRLFSRLPTHVGCLLLQRMAGLPA